MPGMQEAGGCAMHSGTMNQGLFAGQTEVLARALYVGQRLDLRAFEHAQRLAASQARVLALLGGSLATQAAKLLAEEAVQGRVELPQRTLAAMLGVQRPSLNKVLKDRERDGLIRIGYSSIEVLDRTRLITRG